MRRKRRISVTLVVLMLQTVSMAPALSQSSENPSDEMTVLDLKTPIRFIAESGVDTDIQPGTYRVSAKPEGTLQLTSASTGAVRNLRASTIAHGESLIGPFSSLIEETGSQKHFHLILLLPNGQGLDAIGQRESVQTRGIGDLTKSTFNPTRRYIGVVLQQGRVATDQDWNEQDAVSSTGPSAQPSNATPSYGRVTLEEGRLQLDKDARRALFRRCKTCWKSQH